MDENAIIKKLKELTKTRHVKLVNSGNVAIFLALFYAKTIGKKTCLIPDQGGWISYKTYPLHLGLKIREVKTDYGLFNLDDLDKKLDKDSVLIYENPAGYYAEQNANEIYGLSKKKGSLCVLDASGSIGDLNLCSGTFADIIVASFSSWKPVNLGVGGAILFNDKNDPAAIKDLFSISEFSGDLDKLDGKLDLLKDKYAKMYALQSEVKQKLKDFKVLHQEKKGLNVIVKYDSIDELKKLEKFCKDNDFEFVLCPKYIKVNEKAISIELKRRF